MGMRHARRSVMRMLITTARLPCAIDEIRTRYQHRLRWWTLYAAIYGVVVATVTNWLMN